MVERKKNLELKKHVATIHSSHKLTLLQRKIANALLFNAYDDLLHKDEYTIHVAHLCKIIGYASNDHKTIKKSLVNLLSTVIEWNLVDGQRLDSEGVWNASSIIADASIDGPLCTYSYSNKMKKLLHRPELYGRINMEVQAQFQSTYGLALYENCVRFQRIQQTPWFDIPTFRKLMGVEGTKYRLFRDFKTRVLDKALEEVNKYAGISVVPQFRKQGRQVIAIQFLIQPASMKSENHLEKTSHALLTYLKSHFGLSKKQADMVLANHEEVYIREKIRLIEESQSYKQGKIKHVAKYFLCALKEDYQAATKSPTPSRLPKTPKLRQYTAQEIELYRHYQYKEIMKCFKKQSKSSQQTLLTAFEKHLGRSIYHDIYLRDGIANILIQDQLCLFLNQKKPKFLEKAVLSLDEYLDQVDVSSESTIA